MNKFDKIIEGVLEEGSGWDIHAGGPTMGQSGEIIVFMGPKPDLLAKAFGIKSDEWKLTKIGNGWFGAYDGDRLTLFSDQRDYEPMDDTKEDY
jgi:hypothetical protein